MKDGGVLSEITPHSGHYRPSTEDFARCLASIEALGVDMSGVAVAKPKKRKSKDLNALVEAGKLAHETNATGLPIVGHHHSDDEDHSPSS